MKKRLIYPIFCILILGLCGCEKALKPTNNNNKETSNRNNCSLTQPYDMYFEKNFSCPEMKNIKQNGNQFFITNNGELYEYSDKKYSTTETNCKKVETDIVFDKIIRNTLVSKNGDFYSYYESNLKKIPNEEIEKGRAWYGLDQMEIKLYKINKNIFYLKQIDHEKPEIYGYIDDKNVYAITYDWDSGKTNKELIYTFEENEIIENVTNGYIITNNGYYIYDITNKNECNKYEDIKCQYGLVKTETKSDCSENIIYISDNLLVNKEMVK